MGRVPGRPLLYVILLVSSKPMSSHPARPVFCMILKCNSPLYFTSAYNFSIRCPHILITFRNDTPEYQNIRNSWWCIEQLNVYSSSFFELGTRWRWMVSFTPQPLYPQGNSPWYSFDRRQGGPHSHSGRDGEKKNSQPLRESNFDLQPVA
jgi:hypothetical protein